MPDHLEFPRPLRLLGTVAWSLIESAGLPIGALAVGAWLYGRDAGLLAGLAATWLTALIRKIATGSVPSLLTITAGVLTMAVCTVSTPAVIVSRLGPRHRAAVDLSAPVPGRQPGHVGVVRAHRARAA